MRFMQIELVLQTKNRSEPAKKTFSVALVFSERMSNLYHLSAFQPYRLCGQIITYQKHSRDYIVLCKQKWLYVIRHLCRRINIILEHSEHVRPTLNTWPCPIPVLVLINLIEHFFCFGYTRESVKT